MERNKQIVPLENLWSSWLWFFFIESDYEKLVWKDFSLKNQWTEILFETLSDPKSTHCCQKDLLPVFTNQKFIPKSSFRGS